MGKTLYEDILNWKKMQKGETIPEVHHQRILENIICDEVDEVIDFKADWYEAFNKVPVSKRDYMRAMLDNGEDLLMEPRIKVSTIHGAKGGEAHNVILYFESDGEYYQRCKEIARKTRRRI